VLFISLKTLFQLILTFDHSYEDHDDSNDEKDVDKAAEYIETDETDSPEH
jgi:hypothetical protein